MTEFTTLMRRADASRRIETDPVRGAWWTGYIRGLRYAHHSASDQKFGTAAEHELWHSIADEQPRVPTRLALGLGYRAGLTLTWQEPDDA
jgi:hypothetical protein